MFGMGYRNPTTRYLRIGALVIVLLAGAVLHHSGGIVVGFASRRGYGRGVGQGYGRGVGAGVPPGAMPPNGPRQNPVASSLAAPGWFPDATDRNVERYWDGTTWTRRRHFDGATWVEENG
jgi:Protein of unknown function (DUF2510)